MQAGPLLRHRRWFIQALRRTFCVTSLNINHHTIPSSFKSLCSKSLDKFLAKTNSQQKGEGTNYCLSFRIESLPNGEPVGSAFQSWMGEGLPVHRGEIFHAVNRLRKFNMIRRGVEVMEWLIRERPYRLKELEYSYLFEFTIKLHGISEVKNLFSRVPLEFQNELLYNNLVMACLDKGVTRISLEYMKKMRELGYSISHLVFNRLITLNASRGRSRVIPKILTQMKADKVTPHVSTYNILMKLDATEHNLDGLTKLFNDMKSAKVEPNEISYCILATAHAVARLYTASEAYVECVEKSMTGTNWSTLDVLIVLYGHLRKESDVERIWSIVKRLPQVRSESYMVAVEAFGRIGNITRAEDIWTEMKSTKELKSTEEFNSMIYVYCKHGLIDKTTAVFREMKTNGFKPNAVTYHHLALGCFKAGLVKEGLKTLELGEKMTISKRVLNSSMWLDTIFSIIEVFAEKGDVENAEKLFKLLEKAKYTSYSFVYNTLIKAYVKAKIYNSELLDRMVLGGARPDAETYSLLKLMEQFRDQ